MATGALGWMVTDRPSAPQAPAWPQAPGSGAYLKAELQWWSRRHSSAHPWVSCVHWVRSTLQFESMSLLGDEGSHEEQKAMQRA